jgi:hypothetical protein
LWWEKDEREDYRRGRTGDARVMRGNRPDPAQIHSNS